MDFWLFFGGVSVCYSEEVSVDKEVQPEIGVLRELKLSKFHCKEYKLVLL